jgi:hypothetical protein
VPGTPYHVSLAKGGPASNNPDAVIDTQIANHRLTVTDRDAVALRDFMRPLPSFLGAVSMRGSFTEVRHMDFWERNPQLGGSTSKALWSPQQKHLDELFMKIEGPRPWEFERGMFDTTLEPPPEKLTPNARPSAFMPSLSEQRALEAQERAEVLGPRPDQLDQAENRLLSKP